MVDYRNLERYITAILYKYNYKNCAYSAINSAYFFLALHLSVLFNNNFLFADDICYSRSKTKRIKVDNYSKNFYSADSIHIFSTFNTLLFCFGNLFIKIFCD